MNSFEGHPIIITEQRYQELIEKEKSLEKALKDNPELFSESKSKLTPAAKRYKAALVKFIERVETVLQSKDFLDLFHAAAVQGFHYKGQNLAQDVVDAKKIAGLK